MVETAKDSGKDICVPSKTTVLGVFDFRAFLNMAMLLSESDKDFVFSSLQEDNYRGQFTDALKIMWKITDTNTLILLI